MFYKPIFYLFAEKFLYECAKSACALQADFFRIEEKLYKDWCGDIVLFVYMNEGANQGGKMRKLTKKATWGVLSGFIFMANGVNLPVGSAAEAAVQEESSTEQNKATPEYDFDEIIVTGSRETYAGDFLTKTGSVGFLGEKNVMDTPFTVAFLSEKTIETFGDPTQPLDSVLANTPSIRQSGSVLHNDFTFRGFRANGTSTYVNGVPGIWTQFNAPTHVAEKVEIVSGPNSGISGTGTQYESDTAGGLVNFVTKKAGDEPLNRYTQTFSGKGLFGEYYDFGRRFGKDKEWGIRVNTENLNGQTSINNERIKAKSIYLDLDHVDEKSKTNLFAGYRDIDILNGQRWFKLGSNVTKMPSVPDASKNYSFDGMAKASYGWSATLNHEQILNAHWKAFLNGGVMRNKLNKNVMYQNSAVTLINDLGDFSTNTQSTTTPQKAYYLQTGVMGNFKTGQVDHALTIAADQAWRNRDAAKNVKTYTIGKGNIYTGLDQWEAVNGAYESALSNKTRIKGWSVVDSMDYKKMNVLVGLHRHDAEVNAYNTATGKLSSRVESDAYSPTYAISYQPIDHLSFYASHSENFDAGTVVGSTYKNAGEILSPNKTKQNEVGIKYLNKNTLTTLSAFDIKQTNNIDVTKNGATYYEQDGEVRHKGVEMTVSHDFAPKWSVMGGVSYLDAKYVQTAKGQYDGIQESGRGKWSAVGVLKYAASDTVDVIGRVMYTGKSPVMYERLWAPSYTVFDLGVGYKTKVMGSPAKINLMCYNLFNKEYWMIARGDNLYLSTPRTVSLSMTLDL